MKKHITERQSLNRFILDSFCREVKRKNIYCDSQGAGKDSRCHEQEALGFQFHTPTLTYDFSS